MKFRWARVIIALSLLTLFVPVLPARAQLDTCDIGLSPHTVQTSSDNDFSFGVFNSSTDPIAWIQITSPGAQYVSLESASASDWNADLNTNTVTFTAGSLAHGSSQGFDLQALAAASDSGTVNWQVQASDNADGSGAITCDGDMSLQLVTNPTQITLSGITVSNILPTSVTVSWDTDAASTSQVIYGLDTTYPDASPVNATLDTHHSVVLTGLATNTGYYYQVKSTTPADGGAVNSGDNTFLTAVYQPPIIIVNLPPTVSVSAPNVPGVTIQATPTEHVPPTVSISTNLTRPFKTPPLITGRATDNVAVARVEYSLDGGKNWLPVDKIVTIGDDDAGVTAVTFSFTPVITEDGNYPVRVRAIDSSSNAATTDPVTLVIDRLPPQLGPLVVSYGPEVITPDERGAVEILAGSRYHLAASAVGGPTNITIEAVPQEQLRPTTTSFTLSQSADTGLWNGLLSFKAGGIYQLTAKSLDGAGNRTSRVIMTVAVTPAGRVLEAGSTQAPAGTHLTLYYFEPTTQSWQVWDGAPYNQANPQTVRSDGGYSLVVPKGEYYLTIEAPHYQGFTSNRFTLDRTLSLASTFSLHPLTHVALGPLKFDLPSLDWRSSPLPPPLEKPIAGAKSLVGQDLTDFNLPTLAGGHRRNLDLQGRPTVLTVLATWSPDSQEQLPALSAAQANHDVNVVPVFSQERLQLVGAYLSTAGYSLTGLVDTDGVLVPSLQIGSLPEHIFVDRDGRIKKVTLGVLSKDELLNQLGGL